MIACMDSVVLGPDLWDQLVGIAGSAPSWVHGCALVGGHGSAHHAPAGYRGGRLWWLRWEGEGETALIALEPCADTVCMLFADHSGRHRGRDPVTAPMTTSVDDEAASNGAAPTGAGSGARRSGERAPGAPAQPKHRADARPGDGPDPGAQIAEAIWALVAAVDRLADARTGPSSGGRHSRDRDSLGGI